VVATNNRQALAGADFTLVIEVVRKKDEMRIDAVM
jgi:hypothetical protein